MAHPYQLARPALLTASFLMVLIKSVIRHQAFLLLQCPPNNKNTQNRIE